MTGLRSQRNREKSILVGYDAAFNPGAPPHAASFNPSSAMRRS
jgi:hypothetical protein